VLVYGVVVNALEVSCHERGSGSVSIFPGNP